MVVSAFFIVVAPFLYFPKDNVVATLSSDVDSDNIIILDAGHGGEDGGAVGVGNILEKDINLAITLKTEKIFELFGYDVILTRKSDTMTCDNGLKNQRERKVSDIKNRLALIEETPCLCAISIHQNIFGGDAHGAQVFYSGNTTESKAIAETIQDGIVSMLQNENRRVIKQSTEDIYILYHTTKPTVLVECGFISNSSEVELLKDNIYQNKMAFAISISTIKYLTKEEI